MNKRNLEVIDYTFGKRDSKRVDTSLPFTENYKETRSLQGANVVIAGYVNAHDKEIKTLEVKTDTIDNDITNIYNDLETVDTSLNNLNNDITDINIEINNLNAELINKQDTLVSGTNIKTINGESLLGSGDIEVATTGGTWGEITGNLEDQIDLKNALDSKADNNDIPTKTSDLTNDSGFITIDSVPTKTSDLTNDSDFINSSYHDSTKQDTLVSGTNIKTINNESILGNGDISIPVPTKTSELENDSDFVDNSYSSSEIKIGKWINGKPVYRQVIQSSTGNTGQEKTIRNIPNFGIMVDIYGSIYWNANLKVGVSTAIGTGNIAAAYVDGGNVIVYVTSGNLANKTCYITVEYTKTND